MTNTAIFLSQVNQYNLTHTIKLKFGRYFYFCWMEVGIFIFVSSFWGEMMIWPIWVWASLCMCERDRGRERERRGREMQFVTLGERRVEKFIVACTLLSLESRDQGYSFFLLLPDSIPTGLHRNNCHSNNIFCVRKEISQFTYFKKSLISRLTKNEYNLLADCDRIMEESNLTITLIN